MNKLLLINIITISFITAIFANLLVLIRYDGLSLNVLLSFIILVFASFYNLNIKGRQYATDVKYLIGFILYCVLSLLWTSSISKGIQNLSVFLGFTLLYIISMNQKFYAKEVFINYIRFAIITILILYLLSFVSGMRLLFPRQTSLSLLVLLPLILVSIRNKLTLIDVICLIFTIIYPIITGSRIASASIMIGVIFFYFIRNGNYKGLLIKTSISFFLFFLLYQLLDLFEFRTSEIKHYEWYDTQTIEVFGYSIYTTGRLTIWLYLIEEIGNNLFFGYGAGSANHKIGLFDMNAHPLNDYLRLLHDYGVIGFTLFLSFLLTTTKRLVKDFKLNRSLLSAAKIIILIGIMISMFTDNVIVYTFVMFPFALILGLKK